jgi:hypothetical protein
MKEGYREYQGGWNGEGRPHVPDFMAANVQGEFITSHGLDRPKPEPVRSFGIQLYHLLQKIESVGLVNDRSSIRKRTRPAGECQRDAIMASYMLVYEVSENMYVSLIQ